MFTKGSASSFITLLVYVDDIVITSPSIDAIQSLKEFLHGHLKLKDLGDLKYFLGLKLARSSKGLVIFERYYTLQLLASKPTHVPWIKT